MWGESNWAGLEVVLWGEGSGGADGADADATEQRNAGHFGKWNCKRGVYYKYTQEIWNALLS